VREASLEDLYQVPKVGPVLAEKISTFLTPQL